MLMKAARVWDATIALWTIMQEKRQMPQRGKFLVARMHAKLLPEFKLLNETRDSMISAYDHTVSVPNGGPDEEGTPTFDTKIAVPEDKVPEFNEIWGKLILTEIDVDVSPISISDLDNIEAIEISLLGELLTE